MDSKTDEAVCYWARFYNEWRKMQIDGRNGNDKT